MVPAPGYGTVYSTTPVRDQYAEDEKAERKKFDVQRKPGREVLGTKPAVVLETAPSVATSRDLAEEMPPSTPLLATLLLAGSPCAFR